jgi:hypothetical protein
MAEQARPLWQLFVKPEQQAWPRAPQGAHMPGVPFI